MSCQLMLLNSSIGEMHRQASAQGCRRATNVISTSKHTVFVRTVFVKIHYKNLMSTAYKIDERIIRNIIEQNTRVVNNNYKLDLIICYKNPKTAQLIMTNNTNKKTQLNTSNVIYEFTCPNEDCMLRSTNYIGSTTTTLSRGLMMHLTNGAILLQGNCIGEPMRYAVSGNTVCKHLPPVQYGSLSLVQLHSKQCHCSPSSSRTKKKCE